MTFILSEDEALRDLLLGMTVADNSNSARAVQVWFGMPDMEVRQQSYPFVTIDLIDVSEATERVMVSDNVRPWYYAPTLPQDADDWSMPYPIPMNLDYQVTTYARQPRHDRQILAQILGNRLPMRFGSVVVKEITGPETDGVITHDCTVRRLDMLNVSKRDTVEAGKRLFMNMFTVRISSEVPSPYAERYYTRVQQVHLTTDANYPEVLRDPSLITTITIP